MEETSSFFSLILPTFNEAENIVEILQRVHWVLSDIPHEVIVIDDDSPDKTWQRAVEFSQKERWVRVERRLNKRGLSEAILSGFNLARGDILGVMDADLSHDENCLPVLIRKIQEGADLAVGSRRIPGGGATKWPFHRRWMSSLATLISKYMLDLPLSDPMSGFFTIRRSFYESCRHLLAPRGYKILVELTVKGRPRKIQEVPFIFRDRKQGHSKLTWAVAGQFLMMVIMLKRHTWRPGKHRDC